MDSSRERNEEVGMKRTCRFSILTGPDLEMNVNPGFIDPSTLRSCKPRPSMGNEYLDLIQTFTGLNRCKHHKYMTDPTLPTAVPNKFQVVNPIKLLEELQSDYVMSIL